MINSAGILALAVLSNIVTINQFGCTATFTLNPSNATVCQGDNAVFYCSASTIVEFLINGIALTDFTRNQSDMDSFKYLLALSTNNFYVASLSIVGAPKYDLVSIMCRESGTGVKSTAAVLRVLNVPSDLTVLSPGNGTLVLNWTTPAPGLNSSWLMYAVEVRNQDSVVLYNATMAAPGPIPALGCRNYTITVGLVCTNSTVAKYTFPSDLAPGKIAVSYSVLQNCSSKSVDQSCFDISIKISCAGPSYTLSIPSEGITINGVYSPVANGSVVFSAPLAKGRKYYGLLTSSHTSVFNVTIGTFDVLETTATASDSGLQVSCTFASQSRAKGCLLHVLGPAASERYLVIRRRDDDVTGRANQTLAGLVPGNYDLKAYDIYEDGSLSSEVASEIKGFAATSMGIGPTTPGYSDIDLVGTLLSTSMEGLAVCVYCQLRSGSTIRGCAFIVHQRGKDDLTLGTAAAQSTACIRPVTPGNYSIAVFEWAADGIIGRGPFLLKELQLAKMEAPSPTPTPTPAGGNIQYAATSNADLIPIIAGIGVGVAVLIVVLIVFIALGTAYHKRKRVGFAVTHDNEENKKDMSEKKHVCSVYEDLQGVNKIDTRIPPAVPPPRTVSDRSLSLKVNLQQDESMELMTLSSRSSETTEQTDISSPPVSACQSETSLWSQKTEPQYQVIPETSNLYVFKSSSVSLQSGMSTKLQPKINNRRHTSNVLHPPAYFSQTSPRFMETTAV